MRMLITGGAGFIGQHVGRALASRGHEVVALDSLLPQVHADPESAAARFPGDVVHGDVASEQDWYRLPVFDAILHLAAETGTAQSMYERERYERVNVRGTRLAAQAAARAGTPIVSLSSRAVYGEGLRGPAGGRHGDFGVTGDLLPSREDDAHQPVSFYGETKSRAERELDDEASAVPMTIIRPQNVVGPGQALHNPYTGVLAAFLARLREGRPLAIYGDGTQTRDFVHVADLADLLVWALEHPAEQAGPRILNSGTGVRTTLTQLAEFAAAASPIGTAGIEYVDVHRAGDIEHACADLERLSEVGAPLPSRTSADAIADFIIASWTDEGAPSSAWDDALTELGARGMAGEA